MICVRTIYRLPAWALRYGMTHAWHEEEEGKHRLRCRWTDPLDVLDGAYETTLPVVGYEDAVSCLRDEQRCMDGALPFYSFDTTLTIRMIQFRVEVVGRERMPIGRRVIREEHGATLDDVYALAEEAECILEEKTEAELLRVASEQFQPGQDRMVTFDTPVKDLTRSGYTIEVFSMVCVMRGAEA